MTTPPGPLSGAAEKPTVYRGIGALLGGGLVMLFCLGGSIDLMVEEGTADLPGASIMFLVASLSFAYGVFPAAYSGTDALVVRNPLRTITLSWGTVARLTAQLSFIAHTAQQRYTVWAVPVSLRDRRKVERSRVRDLAREQRAARGQRGRFDSSFSSSSNRSHHPGAGIDRLSYADQAISEMGVRRAAWLERAGHPIDTDDAVSTEPAIIKWNIATIVPIVACVVFVIVAFVVH